MTSESRASSDLFNLKLPSNSDSESESFKLNLKLKCFQLESDSESESESTPSRNLKPRAGRRESTFSLHV